jgi:glycosyltransferase involved in cell wall biosynthesis
MPQVSVVIPVRNGAKTIARAIDSALAQDYKGGLEVVVANDGSTDHTAEILSRYGERIMVVTLEPSGVSAARNAAVNVARAKYLAFLDADDEWLPHKLSRTVPMLDQDAECVLVFHDALVIDATGRVCSETCAPPWRAGGLSLEEMLDTFNITASCVVMRREVFERCGGFREELIATQDTFLWLMAREHGPFCFVPDLLARYQFVMTPAREERYLAGTAIFERLVRERYGFQMPYTVHLLIPMGLTHMARGAPALARQRYLAALRREPLEPRTYLRLLWTFIPLRLRRSLGAALPERYSRQLNGPLEGRWSCISY